MTLIGSGALFALQHRELCLLPRGRENWEERAINGRESRKPKDLELVYNAQHQNTWHATIRQSSRRTSSFPCNVADAQDESKMGVWFGRVVKDVFCILGHGLKKAAVSTHRRWVQKVQRCYLKRMGLHLYLL